MSRHKVIITSHNDGEQFLLFASKLAKKHGYKVFNWDVMHKKKFILEVKNEKV